ncbi:unnamed protein product [Nezara viridula]|uniref:Uncharacterized protein n=1 Tax=Nezara viridula TaxID=85310 RepID=A0A9P0HRC2_NEZVI|nr:unnamed protein product [Nezara viridula]
MWKFIQRGLRETFERGLNLGRNDVRVNRETKKTTYCGTYPIRALTVGDFHCNRRQNCRQGQREWNEGANGRKYKESYGTQDSFDRLLGAFSCSSALALGWVLSQPCAWFKKRHHHCPFSKRAKRFQLWSKVAVAQPPQQGLKPVNLSNDAIEDGPAFGPVTAAQAFEEAAGNFEKVHNDIFGEIENRKGIDLIEGPKRNTTKAIKYFRAASNRGYLPAFYNLGQCYEQGVGTKQNFAEAAKWYKKAAEKGHATAMYNLGVFYAHGWGGLEASNEKAKQWLEAAANLGQENALAALGRTKDGSPPASPPAIPKDWGFMDSRSTLEDISNDPEELFKLASSYENSPCDDSLQPYLVLELYKMASDLGHVEAKSKYKILQAYNTVGLLTEYVCRGNKPRSDSIGFKFPTLY